MSDQVTICEAMRRCAKLYASMKQRIARTYPLIPLPFSRETFTQYIIFLVGLNVYRCLYCGAPLNILNVQIDHATPLARGGSLELWNCQPCCALCNQRKSTFTMDEYKDLLRVVNLWQTAGQTEFYRRLMDSVAVQAKRRIDHQQRRHVHAHANDHLPVVR